MSESNRQEAVKEKYGAEAKQVAEGKTACCRDGRSVSGCDPITNDLYGEAEKGSFPEEAVAAPAACDCPPGCVGLPCCH